MARDTQAPYRIVTAMKWDVDAQGNVIWHPVKGFHLAPANETIVMARIECAPTPGQAAPTLDAVQLGMTPKVALQLAEDLRKVAEHILSLRGAGKPN
jgi:hypothetical protein